MKKNQTNIITATRNLDEISFIRPILIVLLINVHAFAPWTNAWPEPVGFVPCNSYWWWGKLNYSFMLETFVMISGYIFSLQLQMNKIQRLLQLVKAKFVRLIIPCVLFGILFYVVGLENFEYKEGRLLSTIYALFNGLGHLWFLPMLFWCFILAYCINLIRVPQKLKLIGLFFVALFSFLPLPFRIGISLYYLFFFFCGMCLFTYRERIIAKINLRWLLLFGLFVACFIVGTIISGKVANWNVESNLMKLYKFEILTIIKLIYSIVGIITIYFIALLYTKRHKISHLTIELGNLCFGIYIFQQFVIQILYYKTNICSFSYMTPWIVFVITLILSSLLTRFIRISKMGRKLL